ncbi:hypothetical protein CMV_004835 [Castanea mollissima]|uniref:Uncharacterized protein n=1 Tax=Castanea mollissima TaxID=60419 RepID=A0A8J4RE65_9ROSI|nr:hypothetical protein CMV_004835 [Castanea mollissima]
MPLYKLKLQAKTQDIPRKLKTPKPQAPTVLSLPLCSSVSFLRSQSKLDEIEESSSEFSISLSFRRLVGWHYDRLAKFATSGVMRDASQGLTIHSWSIKACPENLFSFTKMS